MEFDGAKDRFDAKNLRALLLCAGSGAEGARLFRRSERAVNTGRTTGVISIASFILGRKGAYRGVHYSDVPFSVIDTAFYAKNLVSDKLSLKWAYYMFLTYDINSMDSGSDSLN